MQGRQTATSLQGLKDEALRMLSYVPVEDVLISWKGRVEVVLTRKLGAEHRRTLDFINNSYKPRTVTKRTTDDELEEAYFKGVERGIAVLDAAIFELEYIDDAVDGTGFDPDLWKHVRTHAQNEEWQTVASQTAIFVENQVRKWAGDPRDQDGKKLVGKKLYLKVFGDGSAYRLGDEIGEWEGWRALGVGFALALGNVDRHNIQERDDAKQYAVGVLGLGSLLLTQLRYQHKVGVVPAHRRPPIGVRLWNKDREKPETGALDRWLAGDNSASK